MATIKRFEDLKSWQQARELAREIYILSDQGTFFKDFDLKSQIRRACGSVMDNIAEGFERNGKKELIQFLSIAKGSVGEVRSQLYRAVDNEHIDQDTFSRLHAKAEYISKLLANFMTYIKVSELKGAKYLVSEAEPEYRREATLNIKL